MEENQDIYVKYISNVQVQEPPQNKDGIINYNLNIELLIEDGYKPFIPSEVPSDTEIRMYHFEYRNNSSNIEEIVIYDETQEEADERILVQAKKAKIQENDTKRDEALNQGVTYKGVLFDSDTDQKINLLATIEILPEGQTIIWYGMDNQPLECDYTDLFAIGNLITQLHSFCWNKNAEIKQAINKATTIEEVEAIVINYESEEINED